MVSLGAAVGQENSVGAACGITVALLVLTKVGAAVLVMHSILEGVVCWHGLLLVVGLGLSIATGVTSLINDGTLSNAVIDHFARVNLQYYKMND